jgi:hypothetical protein
MKQLFYIAEALALLVLLLGCAPLANGQGEATQVFELIETPDSLSAAQREALDALRARPEVVRVGLLRLRHEPAQEKVLFNLFPDTAVEVNAGNLTQRAEHDYSWTGGEPVSGPHASLVVQGEDVVGTVRAGGKLYQIRPLGGGVHTVAEIDESRLREEPPLQQ